MRARIGSLGLALALGLVPACKGEADPDPTSLAAIEAQGPPHTSDCRSWKDSELEGLPALPEGKHVEAFEQVWRVVGRKHYDPTLACLDWVRLREIYGNKVAEAGDDAEAAYVVINELLGLLGQSHLHATPPSSGISKRARSSGPASVPLAVRWLPLAPGSNERAIVVVDPAVEGHESGIPRGAVLTEIDGEPVEALVTELVAAVGGKPSSRPPATEGARPSETTFTVLRGLASALSCPKEGRKTIAFEDPSAGDASRSLEVECFMPEGERVSFGNLRELPTRVASRLETAEGQPAIGYLAFNIWMLPMLPRIEGAVAELRAAGMQGLIIDLRGNPGGVGAMSIPVARLLLDQPGSLGRMQMREFDQEFEVEANPDAFTGPVAILIDEGTVSTSEIFAIGLRDLGRVTIVGAGSSAGMALPSMIETLPDGGLIQYVVGDYRSGKGKVAEGTGVAPQLLVEETRADHLAGRDPVLDAALARVREQALERASAPAPSEPAPAGSAPPSEPAPSAQPGSAPSP